jgi:hypothetical protein
MWTLTPDNLEQAKNELKGRRAAVEGRYAAELKAIDADLEEVETLERIGHSFSAKHLAATAVAPDSGGVPREPVAVEPEVTMASSEAEMEPTAPAPEATETTSTRAVDLPTVLPNANAVARLQPSPEEPPASLDAAPKGGSVRWRIRMPSDNQMA